MLAGQALNSGPDFSVGSRCNVWMREEGDGDISVAFMDAKSIMTLTKREKIQSVAYDDVKA